MAFRDHLRELLSRVTGGDDQPPTPDQVVVLEVPPTAKRDSLGRLVITAGDLRAPVQYEARFAELLAMGFGWINVSYYGVVKEAGVVAVELPSQADGATVTAVNLSGPTHRVRDARWIADGVELVMG
jgi:hypothetical protein